jgi:diaminohydroxyphosphoribosylaminopyrimidine deaminase / 5-amino-6-(5-phosphoribosylamino)uracil reductase
VRVTLKLATSLDGRIATASGESRWITGEAAREQVHRLRAAHSAVLVGVETAIADDPELTVRLPGYVGGQPARVVLDSRQRLPLQSRLVRDAGRLATIVVTTGEPDPRLTGSGVIVLKVPERNGRPGLTDAMAALEAHLGPTSRLFVEGGGQVAASFLRDDLIDVIEWFRAPIVLGSEGRPAIGGLSLNALAEAPRFKRVEVQALGDDLWERYERI